MPRAVSVLIDRGGVRGAALALVKHIHASDLVAVTGAPAWATEDRLSGRSHNEGAAVIKQIVAVRCGRLWHAASPMWAEDRKLILVGVFIGTLGVQKH